MSSTALDRLTFEEVTDMDSFLETAKSIFSIDMDKQTTPIPPYNEVYVARAAKTADGRIAGGLVGKVLWNTFEVLQLAVNPDCHVAGTKTALMRWAEEAARGEFACNQIFLGAFSWQRRDFFEGLGYQLQWTHEDFPRGHARHYLEKVWPMEARDAPVRGYDAAAADLVLEEWDAKEAAAQVLAWSEAHRRRCGAAEVPAFAKEMHALNALHPDGSLAALCLYSVTWNVLHVDILAVMPNGQRRGVGSAMLKKVDDLAREHGCDAVYLETMSWQARPFYEKNGYVNMATQHDIPVHFDRHILLHRLHKDCSSRL